MNDGRDFGLEANLQVGSEEVLVGKVDLVMLWGKSEDFSVGRGCDWDDIMGLVQVFCGLDPFGDGWDCIEILAILFG
jgi:hypothetical protein